MLLFDVTQKLMKERINFALVGGYALALHGIVRATVDVDLVLNLKIQDFEMAEKALGEINLKSRLPIRAQDIISMREEYINNRNLLAWSFVDYSNPSRQVDILINTDLNDLDITKISVGGIKIPVASLKSLLKMKLNTGRPQDQIDVQNIKAKLDEKKKSKS